MPASPGSNDPGPASPGSARGILLYGMYDISAGNTAPKVRIEMISRALAARAPTETITGSHLARTRAGFRWLFGGGLRRADAVYVESSTSTAMPGDLAFLLAVRLARKPLGVYFRDAYQLFRGLYPRTNRKQLLADWVWRVTMPMVRGLATRRFVVSAGLAQVLRLRHRVLLPPATEPDAPELGAGSEPLVAYVGSAGWADGFDRLVEAMAIVRRDLPEARLRVVGPALSPERQAALPAWVEVRQAGRRELPELLRPARVCAIPRPITPYTDLAIPVKLLDYLSMGKPVVSTAAAETRRILEESGGGITTGDAPEALAAGLLQPLRDAELATRLAGNARRWACAPENSWDARAATILAELGVSGKAR